MTSTLVLLCGLLAAPQAVPARSPGDQIVQSLVEEIRQLRQVLQTMIATTQRAQFVASRLQAQEATVARATQRVDSARQRLADAQGQRRNLELQMKQSEDALNRTADPKERKQFEEHLSFGKANLEGLAAQEGELQTRLVEAQDQLRQEQAKLSALQDRLDRLDRELESVPATPINKQPQ